MRVRKTALRKSDTSEVHDKIFVKNWFRGNKKWESGLSCLKSTVLFGAVITKNGCVWRKASGINKASWSDVIFLYGYWVWITKIIRFFLIALAITLLVHSISTYKFPVVFFPVASRNTPLVGASHVWKSSFSLVYLKWHKILHRLWEQWLQCGHVSYRGGKCIQRV